jgi:hypothetical protein
MSLLIVAALLHLFITAVLGGAWDKAQNGDMDKYLDNAGLETHRYFDAVNEAMNQGRGGNCKKNFNCFFRKRTYYMPSAQRSYLDQCVRSVAEFKIALKQNMVRRVADHDHKLARLSSPLHLLVVKG